MATGTAGTTMAIMPPTARRCPLLTGLAAMAVAAMAVAAMAAVATAAAATRPAAAMAVVATAAAAAGAAAVAAAAAAPATAPQATNGSGDNVSGSLDKQAMSKLTEQPAGATLGGQPEKAPIAAGTAAGQVQAAQPAGSGGAAGLAAVAPATLSLLTQQPPAGTEQQAVHDHAVLAAMQALRAAGLHQLIMQQTFTQLPPGLAPPYGQQLGLAASWLGPTPAPPPPTAQGMPQGLAAFSSMQQHVTSQLAGALPAWAAMLQPAGLPGVLPAGGPPQAPMVTSASLSLDFGAAPPAAAATAALGGGGIGGAAPGNLPGPDVPMLPAAAERAAPAPLLAAAISGGKGGGTLIGHKRTQSPRPSGGSRKKPHPSRSETL